MQIQWRIQHLESPLHQTLSSHHKYLLCMYQSLEDYLGFQLFIRDKGLVRLSERGREYYNQIIEMNILRFV